MTFERPPLGHLESWIASLLEFMQQRRTGYAVAFTQELVRQYRLRELLRVSRAVQGTWRRVQGSLGEQNAHLVAAFGSLWNGCHYCAKGHLLAHNIRFFEQTGRVFPLDERALQGLLSLRDAEILAIIRRLLSGEHERKRALLERQFLLKFSTPNQVMAQLGDPRVDAVLAMANALYDFMNDCSIVAEDADPPPLGPMAKDAELVRRYQEARGQTPIAAGYA